jgi:1-acyl-sn-glycerol-3-phosphate acyltransferase
VKILAKTFLGWKHSGSEHIPASGGVIIASNHLSYLDPPLVCSGTKREVHFLAKKELFGKWYSPVLISNLNTIPVRRGRFDRASYLKAIEIARRGDVLVLFPEGTRSKDGKLREGKTGAAKISIEAGVPVVPACIRNSNRIKQVLFSADRVEVRFGKPIYPSEFDSVQPEKEKLAQYTAEIMRRIGELLESFDRIE